MPQRNILNIPVDFPYDPYSVQLSMMTRIVSCLNKKQNCLIESPTGTGKTMALLCSSLAWLKNNKKSNDNAIVDNKIDENNYNSNNKFDDQQYDLQEDNKKTEIDSTKGSQRPRIFFGTRTHKQIGQVVRELSRSAYKNMPMTILSSRSRSCVNDKVLHTADINQSCLDLRQTESCAFKCSSNTIPEETWDLESMKPLMKKKLICPYYQSNQWCDEASIIFCPYNYILIPTIRRSMKIDLTNAIVILDEGHNIEDICMEGASSEISIKSVYDFKSQCNKLVKYNEYSYEAMELLKLTQILNEFIELLASKLAFEKDDILKKAWNSNEVVDIMNSHNLDLNSIKDYTSLLRRLDEKFSRIEQLPCNKTVLKVMGEQLCSFIALHEQHTSNLSDYRVVITEGEPFDMEVEEGSQQTFEPTEIFLSSQARKRKSKVQIVNYDVKILCMNPGIVFKEIASKTHSIILASGTLAPLASFQRELCCVFDTSLEAGHVVSEQHTMISSISCGPRGVKLSATYKNVETFSFQDELGSIILSCCQSVPHGVLCFFASFSMINKLVTRWKATKVIDEIRKCKTIVIEPRSASDMTQCMAEYYKFIKEGAIMLAVYRGKASEGMDFSDDAARLVIAVGIPFPSITEHKVNLKMDYNDKRCKEAVDRRHYLTGREWYSIQAFRALNQAIGRCIRHSKDWGAMIFVDDRFSTDFYGQSLCKWIRERRGHFDFWMDFHQSLETFVKSHAGLKTLDL